MTFSLQGSYTSERQSLEVKMLTDEEYRAKYADLRRKKTLRKVLILQNTFRELFLHRSEKEVLHMLCQCGHHYYGHKKTPLSDDAKVMFEYLVTHNYNPYTVYKWFLLFLTSETIQEEVDAHTYSSIFIKDILLTLTNFPK